MLTVARYSDIVNSHIARIDYPSSPRGLYAPVEYSLEAGGKRIRPVLTLAVCDALCGNPLKAISQALGVEMFHNFTLLHDDLMDHSPRYMSNGMSALPFFPEMPCSPWPEC